MNVKKNSVTNWTVTLFVLVGFLIASFAANAEIYKWTDANGKIHYSDKPIGEKSKEIKIKVSPVTPQSPQDTESRKQRADQYLRARKEERAEKEKIIAKKKQLKKERKRKCLAAQKEFGRMSRARSIYVEGKDGAREYISDNERTKVLATAKADIKRWCK